MSSSGGRKPEIINQLHLPLLAKRDQLHPLVTFPPLDMAQSFYMPCSGLRGLFAHLLSIASPNIGVALPRHLSAAISLPSTPLKPSYGPPVFLQVRTALPVEYQDSQLPWKFSLSALSYFIHHGILPGTNSDHMDHTYDWSLDWEPRSLTSSHVASMQSSLPETYALLLSLGQTFLKRLTHALLAKDGHFSALLLSALWGLICGHTSLSVQGILGSGKTYSASLLVVILSSVLGFLAHYVGRISHKSI